mgnify:CR=1 FL=1
MFVDVSKKLPVLGNILSTSLVIFSTISFALKVSRACNPAYAISASNTSVGKSPLGLNGEPMYLSTHLSNALSLYARSLPLFARALAPVPTP